MKQKLKVPLLALVCTLLIISACKKNDYLSGGTILDPHVNMTTYDYLKTNKLFDTLVQLIDREGLKDQINGNITFFAPTDYSINELMLRRTDSIQVKYNDESLKYTIDSFPAQELRDSLKAYMFNGAIKREDLNEAGQIYSSLVGDRFKISLIKSNGSLVPGSSINPEFLAIGRVIPDKDTIISQIVQTSGILTKTGVLHVINNLHVFYWE